MTSRHIIKYSHFNKSSWADETAVGSDIVKLSQTTMRKNFVAPKPSFDCTHIRKSTIESLMENFFCLMDHWAISEMIWDFCAAGSKRVSYQCESTIVIYFTLFSRWWSECRRERFSIKTFCGRFSFRLSWQRRQPLPTPRWTLRIEIE